MPGCLVGWSRTGICRDASPLPGRDGTGRVLGVREKRGLITPHDADMSELNPTAGAGEGSQPLERRQQHLAPPAAPGCRDRIGKISTPI